MLWIEQNCKGLGNFVDQDLREFTFRRRENWKFEIVVQRRSDYHRPEKQAASGTVFSDSLVSMSVTERGGMKMRKSGTVLAATFFTCVATLMAAAPATAVAGAPYRAARNAAISQARKAYQQQMKLQAEEQKAIEQEMQKALEAEASQERHKREMHIKANRLRSEREAKAREAAIARRKAENAANATKEDEKPLPKSKAVTAK